MQDSVANAMAEGSVERMRGALMDVYDDTYRTLQDLYGGSNDDDELGYTDDDDDDGILPPFETPRQLDPRRAPRPYSSALTDWDDSGFTGLEPPVG